jgi:citrate lyase subunit beta/citryl-CoA lyase
MLTLGDVSLPRSYLFVPANRADRIDKALASGAGAVIVDLEDAIVAEHKTDARATFAQWCQTEAFNPNRLVVRINDQSTPWFAEDLAVIASSGVRSIMLPKTENTEQVERAASALRRDVHIIPLIESAKGVMNLETIANLDCVERLAFGTLDYALDVDLSEDDRGLLYPAALMAIASRAAGIGGPIAGVTVDLNDETKLLADVQFARACGFTAKLCIHPRQLPAVEAAFRPAEAELSWAERVIAAAQASTGAVQVDGRMVDAPVLARARRILGMGR